MCAAGDWQSVQVQVQVLGLSFTQGYKEALCKFLPYNNETFYWFCYHHHHFTIFKHKASSTEGHAHLGEKWRAFVLGGPFSLTSKKTERSIHFIKLFYSVHFNKLSVFNGWVNYCMLCQSWGQTLAKTTISIISICYRPQTFFFCSSGGFYWYFFCQVLCLFFCFRIKKNGVQSQLRPAASPTHSPRWAEPKCAASLYKFYKLICVDCVDIELNTIQVLNRYFFTFILMPIQMFLWS